MIDPIYCFNCGAALKNLDEDGFQPSEGLAFVTPGHYGSTVFDPMDGTFLELAICDDCLKEKNFRVKLAAPVQNITKTKYSRWEP